MAKASEFERHAVSRRIFLRREKNQLGDSSKKGRCECNFRGGNSQELKTQENQELLQEPSKNPSQTTLTPDP
jgi:hypothetical protein